jgi:hypothetical protein
MAAPGGAGAAVNCDDGRCCGGGGFWRCCSGSKRPIQTTSGSPKLMRKVGLNLSEESCPTVNDACLPPETAVTPHHGYVLGQAYMVCGSNGLEC